MKKTLVVGLGNPILTDDGVGVLVAREVAGRLNGALSKRVDVVEASVGGVRLMEMLVGYERVILVDALSPGMGEDPGGFRRMSLDDLESFTPTQHWASAHDTNLITALKWGQTMQLPLPAEVIIYAVGAETLDVFSDHPTPTVSLAIPKVVEAVMDEIRTLEPQL